MDEVTLIRLYNADEAAKAMNISERTVKQYIRDGKLSAQKVGGRWMVSEENIKRFLDGKGKPRSGDSLAVFVDGLAAELRDLRREMELTKAPPLTIKMLDGILKSYIGPMELLAKVNV